MPPLKQENIMTVPIEKLDNMFGQGENLLNHWWIVDKQGNLVFYKRGRDRWPQCNSNEQIARHIRKTLYPDYEVAFVPRVFIANTFRG